VVDFKFIIFLTILEIDSAVK